MFHHDLVVNDLSLFSLRQTEEGTQGHVDIAKRPRERALTLKGGLSPDDALQQQRQEFVSGAGRKQELLRELVGRYGGNGQNSVQVTREAQTALMLSSASCLYSTSAVAFCFDRGQRPSNGPRGLKDTVTGSTQIS